MKPNALRGVVAVVFLVAVIGAYLLGREVGEDAGAAAALQDSKSGGRGQGPGGSLSALGSNADRAGDSAAAGKGVDAGKPASVKSIIAQARTKMQGGMMNASGMMRALALLDAIGDEQIGEALAEVERTVKEPQQKMMFAMLLLGRWAESDGPAALAYADEHFAAKSPMMMGLKSNVVSSWAQNDPEGAWKWYLEQKDEVGGGPFGSGRSMAVMGIISSLAIKDVDLAFDRLATIENPQDRQMAMQGLGQAIWDEGRRAEILAKIDSLEDAEEKTMIRSSVVAQWAQMDPDGALAWTETLDEDARSATVKQIAQSMTWSDPQRSGELMLAEAKTPEERSQAYVSAISSWAHNDPNGAGEWLAEQHQGPELDQARQQFSTSVVQKDPESAMAWADAISDDTKRSQAVQNIYLQWRSKDEAGANAAINDLDLTAERLDELRAMEAPKTPTGTGMFNVYGAGVGATVSEVVVEDLEAPAEEAPQPVD